MADLFTPAPGDLPPIAAPLVFCGQCRHFDLESSGMKRHGYGLCSARDQRTREAFYTSAENKCRIGKFAPKGKP